MGCHNNLPHTYQRDRLWIFERLAALGGLKSCGTGLEEPAGLVDEAGLERVEEFLVFGEGCFR